MDAAVSDARDFLDGGCMSGGHMVSLWCGVQSRVLREACVTASVCLRQELLSSACGFGGSMDASLKSKRLAEAAQSLQATAAALMSVVRLAQPWITRAWKLGAWPAAREASTRLLAAVDAVQVVMRAVSVLPGLGEFRDLAIADCHDVPASVPAAGVGVASCDEDEHMGVGHAACTILTLPCTIAVELGGVVYPVRTIVRGDAPVPRGQAWRGSVVSEGGVSLALSLPKPNKAPAAAAAPDAAQPPATEAVEAAPAALETAPAPAPAPAAVETAPAPSPAAAESMPAASTTPAPAGPASCGSGGVACNHWGAHPPTSVEGFCVQPRQGAQLGVADRPRPAAGAGLRNARGMGAQGGRAGVVGSRGRP